MISRLAHQAFFLDDEEILRRINALYRKASLAQVFGEWTRLKDEGRYHERNHKPEEPVMWRTAAYVDINAWSAGIVKKAERQ